MTVPNAIAALVTARRLEHVPAEIAYIAAYDAMRIAVTAHMLARGYRMRASAGAHEAVGVYAEAMISSPSTSEYQRMRRRRNKAEYDDIIIGSADLKADLAHAAAIIRVVRATL